MCISIVIKFSIVSNSNNNSTQNLLFFSSSTQFIETKEWRKKLPYHSLETIAIYSFLFYFSIYCHVPLFFQLNHAIDPQWTFIFIFILYLFIFMVGPLLQVNFRYFDIRLKWVLNVLELNFPLTHKLIIK